MDYAYLDVPPLRAVVSRIAYDVADKLEWRLYHVKGKDGKSPSRAFVRNLSRKSPVQRRALIREMVDTDMAEEVFDHDVLEILGYYNDAFGANQTEQLLQTWIDLHGSAFVMIEADDMSPDIIGELIPVHPGGVEKTPDGDYRVQLESSKPKETVDKMDIVHIRDPNPADPYGIGAGIAEALRDELSAYELASIATSAYFRNKAMPDVIAMFESQVSKADANHIKEQWEDLNRGAGKWGRTMFTDKQIKFHERKSSFPEADVGGLKDKNKETSYETFAVPPGMLGRNVNENRATLTSAQKIYTMNVLIPRMERIRDAYQRRLLSRFEDASAFILDFDPPEVADYEFALDVYKEFPWAFSKNQVLGLAGMPKVDGGDEIAAIRNNTRLINPKTFEVLVGPGGAKAEPDDGEETPPGEETDPEADPEGNDPELDEDGNPIMGVIPGGKSRWVNLEADQIEPVLASIRHEIVEDEIKGLHVETVTKVGQEVLDELVEGQKFNARTARVQAYLNSRKVPIVGITDETRKILFPILKEGVEQGQSIDVIQRNIRKTFLDFRRYRAARIARTEIIGGANFSIYEGQVQSGVVKKRKWLATLDDRTRDRHRELHGTVISIETDFQDEDGNHAIAPGQFGTPGSDINCRCTTIAVIEDVELAYGSPEHIAYMRAFEKQVEPHEAKFKRKIRAAFARQQADLIDRLKTVMAEAA